MVSQWYEWASVVAQMVKNLPAMQKIQVRSLEKGMATHSSILAWKIPWTKEPGRLQSHGVSKSWTRLRDFYFLLFRGVNKLLCENGAWSAGCLGKTWSFHIWAEPWGSRTSFWWQKWLAFRPLPAKEGTEWAKAQRWNGTNFSAGLWVGQ